MMLLSRSHVSLSQNDDTLQSPRHEKKGLSNNATTAYSWPTYASKASSIMEQCREYGQSQVEARGGVQCFPSKQVLEPSSPWWHSAMAVRTSPTQQPRIISPAFSLSRKKEKKRTCVRQSLIRVINGMLSKHDQLEKLHDSKSMCRPSITKQSFSACHG